MGQLIEVSATPLGEVALFDLNRSLTGQDGVSFDAPPDEPGDPPGILAKRLFASDDQLHSVHVLSNTITINRADDWDSEALESATDVIAQLFVFYAIETPDELDERLREEHYNAAITSIRAHNSDLWIIRVRPDEPIDEFEPGQYTTLALGYWEPRADQVSEDFAENPEQREKMARRSYSVSSSIINDSGELESAHPDDVEFYIVQVRPGDDEVPALTPRIFMKEVGDRIYMGRKFTGRYTLEGVEPTDKIVFLCTGTGEAPQNNMTAELLRNEHQGSILNVVCVRYLRDLAYTAEQATVQEKYPNYRYETITTREPEDLENKVYIQDLITSGRVEEMLEAPLDPSNTHVFLCGNPKMIGLPKWDDHGQPTFPEVVGVCELLADKGFKIDQHKDRGNVHYEEYWKER